MGMARLRSKASEVAKRMEFEPVWLCLPGGFRAHISKNRLE